MKRWGLRASYLSADTNANAGQNAGFNHLKPQCFIHDVVRSVLFLSFDFCRLFVRYRLAVEQAYSLASLGRALLVRHANVYDCEVLVCVRFANMHDPVVFLLSINYFSPTHHCLNCLVVSLSITTSPMTGVTRGKLYDLFSSAIFTNGSSQA